MVEECQRGSRSRCKGLEKRRPLLQPVRLKNNHGKAKEDVHCGGAGYRERTEAAESDLRRSEYRPSPAAHPAVWRDSVSGKDFFLR